MTDREKLFFYHGTIIGTMGPLGQEKYTPPIRVIPLINKIGTSFVKEVRDAIAKEIEDAIIELEKNEP